jgi:transcriptional regulator with XRE-family HTH domain
MDWSDTMSEKVSMTFGKRVRELRLKEHLSQRDLAGQVGVDFTYLSKIENGIVDPPSDSVIKKIAKVLEVDTEELLALAAKVSPNEFRDVVEEDNRIGVLFRRLQSGALTDEQIKGMLKISSITDSENVKNRR